MIGQTVSHYKILSQLGEGGMGVVYKAQDIELDRIVALKFLPQRLTSNEAERARFLQEAKAASALNHPNVCTIYGIDEYQGQKFIEMEYVDGVTLRAKISEAPLKISDALTYAIQTGDALHEAHSKGIVHRDIKCENIMVNSKNQIKVMDFGLAKLKGSLKLTRTSSTVGTLGYMAPEQIQGGEVDSRSDIFSFGVVLSETLTGKLPFRGEHEAAMMYSIVNEAPESVLKERPEIPPDLDRIIQRALEKDPADRYQHIDDMVSEIRRIQKQSARVVRPEAGKESREWSTHAAPGPPGTAPPGVREGAASSPLRSRKALRIGLAAGLVVIAAAALLMIRRPPESARPADSGRKMLVVLPFENLGTPDQEYFADGITEEITSRLSGLSGLGVIARSSAMQYKKTAKPVKQIGEELGVAYVLQGTVRYEKSDGTTRVRVTPQLISVADGTQMWSQPSEAVMASAFKLQAEIAGDVATAMNISLLQQEKQSLEAKLTDNSEAYDTYLQGVEYQYRGSAERDLRISLQLFQKSVDLDPKFLAAYSRLAAMHANMYWELFDHTPERARMSREAAERAMQLDPQSADAHAGMGWYYYHCLRDYAAARKEFQQALRTQPNNPEYLIGVGSISRREGNFDDAIDKFKRIAELDPRSPGILDEVGFTFTQVRRFGEADQYFKRALNLAPDLAEPYYSLAFDYIAADARVGDAQKLMDDGVRQGAGVSDPQFPYFQVYVYTMAGEYAKAAAFLESGSIDAFDYQWWYVPKKLLLGELYGYLGENQRSRSNYEEARTMLERETAKRPDDSRIHSSLGVAYAGLGRKEDAIREGKRGVELLPVTLEAMVGPARLQDLAQIYTMTGEYGQAIDQLAALLAIPSNVTPELLRIDPIWKPLRNDARFQKLIAQNQRQ